MDFDRYKADMQGRLQSLPLYDSLSCSDPHCCDARHTSERDTFVLDILCSVVQSSHTTLPMAGGRRAVPSSAKSNQKTGDNISGWTEEVEPFRDMALFWHSTWVSAGRPNRGGLHVLMSSSRNQYHYAVRRTKRKAKLSKAIKLFEASMCGDMDLLREMKTIRSGGKGTTKLPENVGGAHGEKEIVEQFREVPIPGSV